jgi:regulator of sirC expression with transglutaminase-like and TPR domain
MLNNLKAIYLTQSDIPRSLAVIERILLLVPDSPMDQRDRGLLYYQTGRWTEASQDLEDYLLQVPEAQDAVVVRELLRRMGREV